MYIVVRSVRNGLVVLCKDTVDVRNDIVVVRTGTVDVRNGIVVLRNDTVVVRNDIVDVRNDTVVLRTGAVELYNDTVELYTTRENYLLNNPKDSSFRFAPFGMTIGWWVLVAWSCGSAATPCYPLKPKKNGIPKRSEESVAMLSPALPHNNKKRGIIDASFFMIIYT